jgi:hypothetical protein
MNTARSSETPDPTLRNNPRDCHLINNLLGSRNLYLIPYIYEFRKFKTLFIIAYHKQVKRIHSANAHLFFSQIHLNITANLRLRLATFLLQKCVRFYVPSCACYIISHLICLSLTSRLLVELWLMNYKCWTKQS